MNYFTSVPKLANITEWYSLPVNEMYECYLSILRVELPLLLPIDYIYQWDCYSVMTPAGLVVLHKGCI